ncbi:MAG TPA: reverse transcriptase domain-containing protein [Bacteroidia bacterium]|nr:reverse transcriptase domain-containing protein [Bacteroidia bacterium]
MKIEKELLNEIRKRYPQVLNEKQLTGLINHVLGKLYPNVKKPIKFEAKTLRFLAFKKNSRYKTFQIPKKNGDTRDISAPIASLKLLQKAISVIFTAIFNPHHCATGFVYQKSIVHNAKIHVDKAFVYNIDLKEFFPSTDFRRVKTVLGLNPFNLSGDKEPLAFLIANLCCENGVLPQGAPTSPILTNIVCQRLDRKLFKLSKENGCRYSRYADDITFSSNKDIFIDDFIDKIEKIVKDEKYNINETKVRLQSWKNRQEVTGLIVNRKVNVNQSYMGYTRLLLYVWDSFGFEFAQKRLNSDIDKTKVYLIDSTRKSLTNVLKGRIDFISMVRGKDDVIVKRMLEKYQSLVMKTPESVSIDLNSNVETKSILEILNIWESEGVENAMLKYKL